MMLFIRIRTLLPAVFIALFVIGCTEALTEQSAQTFTQPQPVNTKTLLRFPGELQGKYLSMDDSSIIKIEHNFIIRVYEGWNKIANSAFDSSFTWSNDSVIEKGSEQKYYAIKQKNSISVYTYFQDTVIVLNASTVLLKKFKGNYYLNQQLDNHNWSVKMINISKNKLMLNAVFDSTHLIIDTVTSEDIAAPKPLNLSKKEFKKYVQSNNFEEREAFIRVE
ncbi:hypothetical protein F0919_11215 [Taibaiella lutea]|uniref:Uncharacterized protein n=1 Tax=Taibaiella lutea TaxID=2608001 RepID=A0A5M6CDC2_9BACT|nr:hypothetical protein [Taibaiella lutea]KAA5533116.1 hypothetical protein F0919_11215 [Taibaiella lutea]